jgi:hypothetical protein
MDTAVLSRLINQLTERWALGGPAAANSYAPTLTTYPDQLFASTPEFRLKMLLAPGDSGEAERLFRKEAEWHSGMIPNTVGA